MAATAHGTAAVSPTYQPVQHAQLLAATEKAAKERQQSGLLADYTVQSATRSARSPTASTTSRTVAAIFWANKHQIRWANIIQIGQRLSIPVEPGQIPSAPSETGPPVAPVAAPVQQASSAPVQAPVAQAPVAQAPVAQAPVAQTPVAQAPVAQAPVAQAAPAATNSGGSSFQQCVISRESGGNSQVMNGSGHYGLYQFSASTWAAYGGSSSSFATRPWPSRTRCSTTPSRPAASPTGRPTTAADLPQRIHCGRLAGLFAHGGRSTYPGEL